MIEKKNQIIEMGFTEEFRRVKEKLRDACRTEAGKNRRKNYSRFCRSLRYWQCCGKQRRQGLSWKKPGTPPLTSLKGAKEALMIAGIGGCLTCGQLEQAAAVLTAVKRMKDYLRPCKEWKTGVPY